MLPIFRVVQNESSQMWKRLEPILISPQTVERFNLTARFQNMKFYNISFTGLDIEVIP